MVGFINHIETNLPVMFVFDVPVDNAIGGINVEIHRSGRPHDMLVLNEKIELDNRLVFRQDLRQTLFAWRLFII